MELQEFVKKYLPEKAHFVDTSKFYDNVLFSEALQAFTDKVCSEQRVNCAEGARHKVENLNIDRNSILNAPQPKIEDL